MIAGTPWFPNHGVPLLLGELKAGVRVHVTVRTHMAGYRPGDTGTVLRASPSSLNGERYYLVAMDKDGPSAGCAVFTEGEIEADG
jgi:hypothetical protein